MTGPLLSVLTTVEHVVDHSITRVRRRFGLWDDIHVLPYHGYGRPDRVRLRGRVLDDEEVDHEGALTRWESARLMARRFISDEVPGARIAVTLGDQTVEATTDADGYYDVEVTPAPALGPGELWREATVRLLEPVEPDTPTVVETHRFQVPSADARFALISDLDDTVVRTGATNKLRFARIVLFNNATTREVFPASAPSTRFSGKRAGRRRTRSSTSRRRRGTCTASSSGRSTTATCRAAPSS